MCLWGKPNSSGKGNLQLKGLRKYIEYNSEIKYQIYWLKFWNNIFNILNTVMTISNWIVNF